MKVAIAALLVCLGMAVAQTEAPSQGGARKGGQKGMMHGRMAGGQGHCPMHSQETMEAMSALSKQVDEARRSNDVAKMREALDAVAKHHEKMRQQMAACMKGAGGSGSSGGGAGQGHQHGHGAQRKN